MKAPDITTLINKTFENKFKQKRETRSLDILILDTKDCYLKASVFAFVFDQFNPERESISLGIPF